MPKVVNSVETWLKLVAFQRMHTVSVDGRAAFPERGVTAPCATIAIKRDHTSNRNYAQFFFVVNPSNTT